MTLPCATAPPSTGARHRSRSQNRGADGPCAGTGCGPERRGVGAGTPCRPAPCFSDIAHTATVERGEVWEVLSSLVEEKKIDLIVVGTHGRRGLKKLVLGSMAEQVFRQARCPVLTIGPHARTWTWRGPACADSVRHRLLHRLPACSALCGVAGAGQPLSLILLHAVPPSVAVLPGSMDAMVANVECRRRTCSRTRRPLPVGRWKS